MMADVLNVSNYGKTPTMYYDAPARTATVHEVKYSIYSDITKQHTPSVMTNLICGSMEHWIHCCQITPPQQDPNVEPILNAISIAFTSQKQIGWDQFFHG